MSNQKLFVDLPRLEKAIEEFASLPADVTIDGVVDIDAFIEYIDLVLNSNVFPQENDIYPEDVESPDTDVLARLKEKGFEISEDGYIESFAHSNQNIRLLQFFARLSRGMFYLNKYIAIIGIDNIRKGIYNRKDSNLDSEARDDVIRFGILYLEYFFKLMEFAYTNFYFKREGEMVSGGKAIGSLTGNIFRGVNSLLGKWYGPGLSDFASYVRTSIGSTFSAWLVLRGQYDTNYDIRPANSEEDLNGIDFVVLKDGKEIKYVQCKARRENDGRSSAYVTFGGKSDITLPSLKHYVESEAQYDPERSGLMIESASKLIALAKAKDVEWEWVFVESNYYVTIST